MIGTTSVVEVAGMAKAVTVGEVMSGRVMTVEAFLTADTLPAASLAQAYRVLVPAVVKL